jgi:hypothetical protein
LGNRFSWMIPSLNANKQGSNYLHADSIQQKHAKKNYL